MTDQPLQIMHEGRIGLIGIDNPPVNALGAALRQGLANAIHRLNADPSVEVIAIYGEGRNLSAGADIREFGKPPVSPRLPDVFDEIETSAKPVITVIHGTTLGGGLELALASHARIAMPGARMGLPEVGLGLLPGAGGTQRLPRLIALEDAIDLISSGRQITAEDAKRLGLVDDLGQGSPRDAAVTAARAILNGSLEARRTGQIGIKIDKSVLDAAVAHIGKKRPVLQAPIKAVEAIALAEKPIAEGLRGERTAFMELMQGADRQGLIHAFSAERAIRHIPESAAMPRMVAGAGVVGGGTMGVGIATALITAGIPVTLIEMAADRAEKAKLAVLEKLAGAVKRGKMDSDTRDALARTLTVATDMGQLAEVDLVVEAVFEDIVVKTEIFGQLDAICKSGAVLGTNTSYLDVNAIAAATRRPEDVIGLHFFSPAHVMRLLEVVVADKSGSDVVATAFDLAARMKKIAVRSGVCDGFIGNRILAHYRKVADHMMEDGVSFDQIDRALEDFGFAMGPFAVADLAGLDIGWATRKRKGPTRPANERYSQIADRICEHGWFGRKTGRGYYLYDDAQARRPNPDVMQIVEEERKRRGVTPQPLTDDEIVARYMTAMICEAARVVEEGIALRPIDVDAVFLFGYGFPRHLGGPLNYADRLTAKKVVERIERYGKEDPHYWQVPALLCEMAASGQQFADLN